MKYLAGKKTLTLASLLLLLLLTVTSLAQDMVTLNW